MRAACYAVVRGAGEKKLLSPINRNAFLAPLGIYKQREEFVSGKKGKREQKKRVGKETDIRRVSGAKIQWSDYADTCIYTYGTCWPFRDDRRRPICLSRQKPQGFIVVLLARALADDPFFSSLPPPPITTMCSIRTPRTPAGPRGRRLKW